MAIFLLFFKLFVVFFLHYVSVIFKKWEPLIKLFFTAFVRFKLRCKMSGVILNGTKKVFERGVIKKSTMQFLMNEQEVFSSNFKHSYKNV